MIVTVTKKTIVIVIVIMYRYCNEPQNTIQKKNCLHNLLGSKESISDNNSTMQLSYRTLSYNFFTI